MAQEYRPKGGGGVQRSPGAREEEEVRATPSRSKVLTPTPNLAKVPKIQPPRAPWMWGPWLAPWP